MLPTSDSPILLMPTFRTYKGDYFDSVAAWWGLVRAFVWVFPAIHNPDGLFIGFCPTNLTFHHGYSIRCLRPGNRVNRAYVSTEQHTNFSTPDLDRGVRLLFVGTGLANRDAECNGGLYLSGMTRKKSALAETKAGHLKLPLLSELYTAHQMMLKPTCEPLGQGPNRSLAINEFDVC
jgi:hypothetical protein